MLYNKIWNNWRENGKFISKKPDSGMDAEFIAGLAWCMENKIQIFQNYSELYILWKMVKDYRVSCMLEIGCAYGGSLFMFSRALRRDARIIAIDLPNSQGGAADCRESFDRVIAKLESEGQDIHVIIGDSRSHKTIVQCRRLTTDYPLEFVFLDGGHSYDTVKHDFQVYGSAIERGGIIALHDISDACESWIEVPKFWKEIRQHYRKSDEIKIKDAIGGVGIIYP